MVGSHNDINVLHRSLVFVEGHVLEVNYDINRHAYTKGYYLADGIYLKWLTFVKTIHDPFTKKKSWFAKRHESCKKDIERAFGVLQSCFAIIRYLAFQWSTNQMWEINE
jgi:hypothetical protein